MSFQRVKEISVVIPCLKESYDSVKVDKIYSTLKDNFNRFELVLCTSNKFTGMCNNIVIMTNNRPNLKCYFTTSKSVSDVVKIGVSSCMYNMIAVLRLEDFSDIDYTLLSSIKSLYNNDRYNTFFSNSIVIMRSFDISEILSVCQTCSVKEILNVCDYFNFSLIDLNLNKIKSFNDICISKGEYKKYIKSRRKKLYDTRLCYLKRGKVI